MQVAEQKKAAKKFSEDWKGQGYEKGQSQAFWIALLSDVLGVKDPTQYIEFEDEVHLDKTSFIDGYIPKTHVLIEQKGINKDLNKGIRQSDGSFLTPFQQAKRYSANLPYSKRPRWIVTCNFNEFNIYDMEKPVGEPIKLMLADLPKQYYLLDFLIDQTNVEIKKETNVSVKAGDLVGKIYDELKKQYKDPDNEHSQRSINQLCVRFVFCLYAEDAGIFGKKDMFHDYLKDIEPRFMRRSIIDLFKVLDTKIPDRDPYLDDQLAQFPYVNGGLFSEEDIEIPNFTPELKDLLLNDASADFDWSDISPTIFGAVFESTLNPDTRREGGMHYTSIENIHRVIDPLFLNNLKEELLQIKQYKQPKTIIEKSKEYQFKLSKLTFFDPACGSGNFLTETYLSLRRLENEAIKLRLSATTTNAVGQQAQGILDTGQGLIKVSIHQFYGIEINDFAVSVAKTALWIAESQMFEETQNIVYRNIDFLPLKTYTNIIEGNALVINWNKIIPNYKLNYLISNPPFFGARLMTSAQKADLKKVFNGLQGVGNLDYVCGWYQKSANYMKGTSIQTAFVSTNSITQGEQVSILWSHLNNMGIKINFAYRTFIWNSEAHSKAHVHCVIIGFSYTERKLKQIYDHESRIQVKMINGYLLEAPDIYVTSRTKPVVDVPRMGIGNKPIDNGNYLFSKTEMENFIKKEPQSRKFFKQWIGAREFIHNEERYCLWLGDALPNELRQMPKVMKLIEQVRNYRLASKSAGTRRLANTPTRFHVENMPHSNYLVIPSVSSERRKYIPIGYMNPDIMASNLLLVVPNATLYEFGVLTSNVHMAWMRAVAGRLEMRYRYSAKIVYNNFPWPQPTKKQKQSIIVCAKQILNARKLYPDSSLADLYDDLTMPPELRKAHQENDKAVMQAYGMPVKGTTESDAVRELFKLYSKLTKAE